MVYEKAQTMRGINREALMKEEPLSSGGRRIIGSMQMFFYDPKHKETLPYYDRFPLSIILKPQRWFPWIKLTLFTTYTWSVSLCVNG